MSLIFHVPYIDSNWVVGKLTSKCYSFQTIPDLFVGKCVFSTVQGTVFRLFSEYLFTSLCLYIWQFLMPSSSGTHGPLVSLTPLDVAIPSLGWFIQMTFDHPQVSARKFKKKMLGNCYHQKPQKNHLIRGLRAITGVRKNMWDKGWLSLHSAKQGLLSSCRTACWHWLEWIGMRLSS